MQEQFTDTEKQFVSDAENGFFGVGVDDDGTLFATGAEKTGNLFSMQVVEKYSPELKTSFYKLPYNAELSRAHDDL